MRGVCQGRPSFKFLWRRRWVSRACGVGWCGESRSPSGDEGDREGEGEASLIALCRWEDH